ncbi:MAG: AEC family transporter [Candidatus Omnitrophota bacterium]
MFVESFGITVAAVAQIFILGVSGFLLVKRDFLSEAGLDALSRLTIDVALPLLIFCSLSRGFGFSQYPNWWIFPLISIAITVCGLVIGGLFSGLVQKGPRARQLLSLVAFQNSGYLPLALFAALLPQDKLPQMFIYLFLFLLGFNFLMFSLGVYILTSTKSDKFEFMSLFNPPVLATLVTLLMVFLGLNKFVPDFIFKPLKIIGDCTLPLAMLVVGGNLAQIRLSRVDKKEVLLVILAKLILLPALGLALILKFKMPQLIGLLVLVELAVPPATNLSVIMRHYKKDDLLISQGVFFSHIISLLTIPLFLSLYFMLAVL